MFVNLLIRWACSAAALFAVAYVVPGISVSGVKAAFVAALVIGLINSTLGVVIKFFTFPLRFLTLGIFSLVVNALMLMLAAYLVDGFAVNGFIAAFLGSIALSIVNWVLFSIFKQSEDEKGKK